MNNQGWRYELEKMVIERSNHIFTSDAIIADCIEAAYPLAPEKVICLDESKLLTDSNSVKSTGYDFRPSNGKQSGLNTISMNYNLDWETQADKIVKVLTEAYSTAS
ncbi:hypothetical protein AHMF7605_08410 [Adhaeribacter arboris]|uniref:Uncharacterized protein n=1 Tax=Adhaeribacter arboris TaxID=2072846 RepID=A0A2T2YDF4_9BACT|nr:hypothetical protein AHMF7605_08410 [Adhaeribacter arboris]